MMGAAERAIRAREEHRHALKACCLHLHSGLDASSGFRTAKHDHSHRGLPARGPDTLAMRRNCNAERTVLWQRPTPATRGCEASDAELRVAAAMMSQGGSKFRAATGKSEDIGNEHHDLRHQELRYVEEGTGLAR